MQIVSYKSSRVRPPLLVQLALMNVFYSAWCVEHIIFIKICSEPKIFVAAISLRSFKQVSWNKSVCYVRYVDNNNTTNTKDLLKLLLFKLSWQFSFLRAIIKSYNKIFMTQFFYIVFYKVRKKSQSALHLHKKW